MRAFSPGRLALIAIFLVIAVHHVLAGGEHSGQVTFGGLPVPGATVTASAGDKKLVTVTDERGAFELADATAGTWTLHVEMLGFEALTREVTVTTEPQPSAWVLTLKPFEEITRGLPPPPPPVATQPFRQRVRDRLPHARRQRRPLPDAADFSVPASRHRPHRRPPIEARLRSRSLLRTPAPPTGS